MIPVTYLSVNWLFTQALIIDKGMDFRTAMKTSWKMVHKHWWHVFGLVVVMGLLNLAGFCLCCVGLLFTLPAGVAVLMFAYETIFSEGQASLAAPRPRTRRCSTCSPHPASARSWAGAGSRGSGNCFWPSSDLPGWWSGSSRK